MARARHDGLSTSQRAGALVTPPSQGPWRQLGAVSGVVIAVGLVVLYLGGVRSGLSPGDVASHHAGIDAKCAQCHDTGLRGTVSSLRCERCHDPAGADRLQQSAHVLLGSRSRRLADQAPVVECVACHREHQGRDFRLRGVVDGECAACHLFPNLSSHPEFAVVRARATAGVGLHFDHDRHVREAQKARGTTCQVCHEVTADRRGFQPITFDRHCASCHLIDGVLRGASDPVARLLVVKPDGVPPDWLAGSAPVVDCGPNDLGRKCTATRLRHRDGWVLYNASRLRRGIDRDGDDAERAGLRATVLYLEQLQRTAGRRLVPPAERDTAIAQLRAEIAEMDRRLAVPAGASTDMAALTELTAVARSVMASLATVDGAPAAPVPEPTSGASVGTAAADADAGARLVRRKGELLKLLDAVAQRTTDPGVLRRVEQLRADVNGIAASPGTPGANDASDLLGRLDALDPVIDAIRNIPDPGLGAEVGAIERLRQLARDRAGLGATQEDFESRRRELLVLLEAIEQRTGDAARGRVDALRQRAEALRPGTLGDSAYRRLRVERQRVLDRLIVDGAIEASDRDRADAPSQDPSFDQTAIAQTRIALRARLAELERAPRMPAPTTEDERLARASGLAALVAACLKCHELDGSGARIAPVRIAEPVMPRSVFNHAPHALQARCETCHAAVTTSKLATDVNVPGVANCQTCHRASQAKADCATCHAYHPSSSLRLAVPTS